MPAGATSGPVTVTVAGQVSNGVAFGVALDTVGPTIVKTYEPLPNSAGWHHAPATVLFACSDAGAGVASCPGPIVFDAEGAGQTVTVTAVDLAGNATTATATVNVDLKPPSVGLTTPTADFSTSAAMVTLVGDVADQLSGVSDVQCQGSTGALVYGTASCAVALEPGRNSVVLLARDAAGHSASVGVTITRVGPTTALRIDPTGQTLLVGEARPLTITNEYGVAESAASWSSADPLVATVDSVGVVTAVSEGTTTITASTAALSATASVTVLAAATWPTGTAQWTVAPSSSYPIQASIYPHRVDETVPDLFTVEPNGAGGYQVRAVSTSGGTLWTGPAPGTPLMGDAFGGVVARSRGTVSALARFAGPATAPPWRYEVAGDFSAPAQGPDGTIYLVETPNGAMDFQTPGVGRFFVALNGQTGEVLARVPLDGYVDATDTYGIESVPRRKVYPPFVSQPVVGEDGRGYIQVAQPSRYEQIWAHYRDVVPSDPNVRLYDIDRRSMTFDYRLSLVSLNGSGAVVTQTVDAVVVTDDDTDGQISSIPTPMPHQTLPDALGGVLVTWRKGLAQTATHFTADGGRQDFPLPNSSTEIVLTGRTEIAVGTSSASTLTPESALAGAGGATAYYRSPGGPLTAVDVATWTPKWTTTQPGVPVMALAEGGVALHDPATGTLSVFDDGGTSIASGPVPGAAPRSALQFGRWEGVGAGYLSSAVGPPLTEAVVSFLAQGGNVQRSNSLRQNHTAIGPAAVEVLRYYNRRSIDTDTEFAGSICRQGSGPFTYYAGIPSQGVYSDGVVPGGCGTGPRVGDYHTHGTIGDDGFSGGDIRKANLDFTPLGYIQYFVATPCGHMDAYVGPPLLDGNGVPRVDVVNPANHRRLRETTDTPIRCVQ